MKESYISDEEMEEKRFCFTQNVIFFSNKEELIQLSDSHRIPHSFSFAGATFVVNNNTIQN